MMGLKRSVGLLMLLVVFLIPREAWLWTQVRHGESPKFSVKTSGCYAITVVGHYTKVPDLAATGVRTVKWESDQPVNRRAEMLALRTAFLDWFVDEWVRQGGTREEAIVQVRNYPFRTDPQSESATLTTRCG